MGTLGKTWRPTWADKERLKARLLARRKIDPVTGCWVYQGHQNPYARMRVDGEKIGVHVVAAWVWNDIPPDPNPRLMVTMHSCDNPPCFNPDHVLRVSQLVNVADSIAKGHR